MSATRAVDSGLLLSRVKPMTLKLVFLTSLCDAEQSRDSVENMISPSWRVDR